jgi:UDPglucose 6-dehydrogenase
MCSMKICVVGTGYVGLVSAACFSEIGHDVVGVDIDEKKVEMLKQGGCPIYEPGLPELLAKNIEAGKITFTTNLDEGIHECELIMAAVGTPVGQGRRADLSQVESVCRTIGQHTNDERILVIKSTVPVGTSKKCQIWVEEEMEKRGVNHHVHLVSNPEFLREGKAIKDFMEPDRIVVGFRDEKAGTAMRELYKPLIDQGSNYLEMNVESSELTKYASNSFLATKISFVNFMAQLCEECGANVERVAEGMGTDSRIGAQFLNAGIGYGGSCFPKDVQALIKTSDALGVDSQLLRDVETINERQRESFVRKIEKSVGNVRGKSFGVWGLAFKPDTDDMRSAPSIDIINMLLDKGVSKIKAYDPVAIEVAKRSLPEVVEFTENEKDAAAGADVLLILTEWSHWQEWSPEQIASVLSGKHVIDGRNVFDPEEMREAGLEYISVGRM